MFLLKVSGFMSEGRDMGLFIYSIFFQRINYRFKNINVEIVEDFKYSFKFLSSVALLKNLKGDGGFQVWFAKILKFHFSFRNSF